MYEGLFVGAQLLDLFCDFDGLLLGCQWSNSVSWNDGFVDCELGREGDFLDGEEGRLGDFS